MISQTASDYDSLLCRHAAVDSRLLNAGLVTVDVLGDGNCLFRSLSYLITGSQDTAHISLRASAAALIESGGAILGGVLNLSPKLLADHIRELRTIGTCAGEEALLVLPDVVLRDIYVHQAFADPILYPVTCCLATGDPVHIAYYEGLGSDPSHYRAVVPAHNKTVSFLN